MPRLVFGVCLDLFFSGHRWLKRRETSPINEGDPCVFNADSRASLRRCRSATSHRLRFYIDTIIIRQHEPNAMRLTSSTRRVSISLSFVGG